MCGGSADGGCGDDYQEEGEAFLPECIMDCDDSNGDGVFDVMLGFDPLELQTLLAQLMAEMLANPNFDPNTFDPGDIDPTIWQMLIDTLSNVGGEGDEDPLDALMGEPDFSAVCAWMNEIYVETTTGTCLEDCE